MTSSPQEPKASSLSRLRQAPGRQPAGTGATGASGELAHLERDFILLASPDLQAWVVPAQLPEPLPIHGKEPTGHHGRPAREEERGVKRGPDGHVLQGHSDTAAPLRCAPCCPGHATHVCSRESKALRERPRLFSSLPTLPFINATV